MKWIAMSTSLLLLGGCGREEPVADLPEPEREQVFQFAPQAPVALAQTQNVVLAINLDQRTAPPAESSPGVPEAFSPADPATYSMSVRFIAWDHTGQAYEVSLYFIQRGGGVWEWHALTSLAVLPRDPWGEFAAGELGFNPDGTMSSATGFETPLFHLHFEGMTQTSAPMVIYELSVDGGPARAR